MHQTKTSIWKLPLVVEFFQRAIHKTWCFWVFNFSVETVSSPYRNHLIHNLKFAIWLNVTCTHTHTKNVLVVFLSSLTRWTEWSSIISSDCSGWVFVDKLNGCKIPLQSLKTSDIAPVSSKEFLDIQASIKCRNACVTW